MTTLQHTRTFKIAEAGVAPMPAPTRTPISQPKTSSLAVPYLAKKATQGNLNFFVSASAIPLAGGGGGGGG